MKFLDKIKDLFSDEEEVIETQEIEIEEPEEEEKEHKLPTFMRNKIEEEQKREESIKQKEMPIIKESIQENMYIESFLDIYRKKFIYVQN